MPLPQAQRDSHNLADNLSLLRVAQHAHRNRRERMRLENQIVTLGCAPAAGVPLAGFHKIDGTLVLRAPNAIDDFVARLIDLDKGSRRENRIHRKILAPDVPVTEIMIYELRQVG